MNLTLAAPDTAAHRSVDDRVEFGRKARAQTPRSARVDRVLVHARTRDNLGALSRFASVVDGVPRIVAEPPLVVPVEQLYPDQVKREGLEQGIGDLLRGYRDSLAYLGTSDRFDRAVTRCAELYADRSEQDHAALLAAIADGRVTAAEQV